jgi:hypothetical protein
LRERILALETVPGGNGVTNDDAALAISLIDDVAALERALVDGIVRPARHATFTRSGRFR